MTYQPDIPRAQDDMSESQSDLNTNFTQLNTQFGVDHGAFDNATIPGKHKQATFAVRATDESDLNAPQSDEIALFSKIDNSGNAELYTQQHNETSYQITKGGIPFIGMKPQAAVNFKSDGTIMSSYNVATGGGGGSVARTQAGSYTITFDTSIKDASGAATANYYWSIQGFDSSNNPVIGTPKVSGTASSALNEGWIKIDFRNQNGTRIGTGGGSEITRGCVIIWSVQ